MMRKIPAIRLFQPISYMLPEKIQGKMIIQRPKRRMRNRNLRTTSAMVIIETATTKAPNAVLLSDTTWLMPKREGEIISQTPTSALIKSDQETVNPLTMSGNISLKGAFSGVVASSSERHSETHLLSKKPAKKVVECV